MTPTQYVFIELRGPFEFLNAPTLEQLQALKLAAMATAWTEQQQQAEMTALAFDERFALLVDAEWRARENKRPRPRPTLQNSALSQVRQHLVTQVVYWSRGLSVTATRPSSAGPPSGVFPAHQPPLRAWPHDPIAITHEKGPDERS